MTQTRRFSLLSLLALLFALLFKLACLALMILIPALGVWTASSLAVFYNKPPSYALLAGLLMFPLLPLGWDLWGSWRRRRKGTSEPRILNLFDRLILRTVTLNALLLGGLLWATPQASFTALSARGDWMLQGLSGPRVELARSALFKTASTLEWLYEWSRENPYEEYDDGATKPKPEPQPTPTPDRRGLAEGGDQDPQGKEQRQAKAAPDWSRWPQAADLHPIIARIPEAAERSWAEVAAYIRSQTDDPYSRARSVHDYVATRVAYDVEALHSRQMPPQDADTVFAEKKGVCAGYAKLFAAMAEAVNLEALYLIGRVRDESGEVDGVGHAWNAVKIAGRWQLVDVTWDAGGLSDGRFQRELATSYFLTPPQYFVADHFPDEPAWQLLEQPIDRGQFIRQPMLKPEFFALGVSLLEPDRSQVTVDRQLQIALKNPKGISVLSHALPYAGQDGAAQLGPQRCAVEGGALTSVRCTFDAPGAYLVRLCFSASGEGAHACLAKVLVNNRS